MLTVLLTIQILLAIAMIGIILIQRTDSDGLSGLGGGGGGNNVLSGRATANILTRSTAILAALFMLNSLIMATLTTRHLSKPNSLIETLSKEPNEEAPQTPTVPVAE